MLMTIPWWLPALLGSFFAAAGAEVNRRYKMGGRRLSFWQLFLSAFFVLPVVVFLKWPDAWQFYAAAALNGFVMSVASVRQLRLSADYNGRVASLFMPLKVIVAFFLWLAVNHSKSLPVFDDPVRFWGVCTVLGAMMGAFFYMLRNKMTWNIMRYVIPISISYAILDILVKLVMDVDGISPFVSFIFVFVSVLTGAICTMLFMILRGRKKVLWTANLLEAGSLLAICCTTGMVCLVFSIQMSDNPAYPTVIMLLSSVWLLIYYRFKKVADNISPMMGTILVFCSMALVFLTRG